ncbi:MAG TPA: hypothetical protein VN540_05865, partial [Clostridia bacterium]|nr:hypothetical protein [Clostridia bacterium]
MKRLIAIVMITLALALAVSGCAAQKPAKDIELEIGGKRALVDTQNGTVNVEGDVYRYAFTADGVLAIEYPNGYGFTRKTVSTGGTAAYATSFLTAEGEPSDK